MAGEVICVQQRWRTTPVPAAAVLLMAAACQSPEAAARPLAFACEVEGVGHLSPAADAAAVCARFRAAIERTLATPLSAVAPQPAGTDWIAVTIRFTNGSNAEALVTRAAGGRVRTLPGVGQSVLDRPMGMDSVDQLAGELARRIAADRE